MLNMEWVQGMLEKQGFFVTVEAGASGEPELTATLETEKGSVSVYAIAKGARIGKPNGSHKYYYEVSGAKLAQYVRQTVAANGGKKGDA